jgi:hypothetical protein
MAEWLVRRTSNLSPGWGLEQKNITLLSTGWFQERFRERFNKFIAFNTIELR